MRSLASFMDLFGVLPKSKPELITKAYTIYKTTDKDARIRKAKAFVNRHYIMWTKVRLLGAWDTVTALGLPHQGALGRLLSDLFNVISIFKYKFNDFSLAHR